VNKYAAPTSGSCTLADAQALASSSCQDVERWDGTLN
jgi:hypothetical protein